MVIVVCVCWGCGVEGVASALRGQKKSSGVGMKGLYIYCDKRGVGRGWLCQKNRRGRALYQNNRRGRGLYQNNRRGRGFIRTEEGGAFIRAIEEGGAFIRTIEEGGAFIRTIEVGGFLSGQ